MTTINTYHLAGPQSSRNVIKNALDLLARSIPISLPLYRRLQFGRFFDNASFLVTNLDLSFSATISASQELPRKTSSDAGASATNGVAQEDAPYILAFVDRSTRPETEVWLYATWESESSPNERSKKAFNLAEISLLRAVLATFASLHLPPSIHAKPGNDSTITIGDPGLDHLGFSRHEYGGHESNPRVMLWGAVHEQTFARLDALGVLSSEWSSSRVPNHSFLFPIADLPATKGLPEGMWWGEVQAKHFALVRSRTQIPRQDRTLAILPSVAIYVEAKEEPIAWAFVGLDGSETTLHVEKEFRGRGLAKAVATKLFSDKMSSFFADDETRGLKQMAHANVINGNEQSVGVCRSLGGRSNWSVYWLRVELETVATAQ